MSMVEKVAEAMSYADRMWEHSAIGNYEALARVAIEAMREPSQEMWRASSGENGYVTKDAWQAMIDAALKEPLSLQNEKSPPKQSLSGQGTTSKEQQEAEAILLPEGCQMGMIEKVSEAIYVAGTTWLNEQSERVEWYDVPGEILARAAIEAMREPSEEMRVAALTCGLPARGGPPLYEMVWRGMLDAALKADDRAPTQARR
jgi:hypothetical protein